MGDSLRRERDGPSEQGTRWPVPSVSVPFYPCLSFLIDKTEVTLFIRLHKVLRGAWMGSSSGVLDAAFANGCPSWKPQRR